MKTKVFLVGMFMFFVAIVFAQDDDYDAKPFEDEEEFVGYNKKEKKNRENLDRIRLGGNFNLGFGNQQFLFSISPLVGYQIIEDRVELGGGFIYEYYSIPSFDYKVNVIGPNGYARLYIWDGLFVQFRGTWQKFYINDAGRKDDLFFANVFGAGGYSFELGDNFFMNVGIEANLIPYDPKFSNRERIFQPFFNFQYAF